MKARIHPLQVAEPAERDIQHAAYFLWEAAGRPAGRDQEFWFTAQERLRHTVVVPTRILARSGMSRARNAQPAAPQRR